MILLKENSIINNDTLENVRIECPICLCKKILNIPVQIINHSKQLTTISVPAGFVCIHSFQAFIDKNFVIRGYQKVDFELSNMEFYQEDAESLKEISSNDLETLPCEQIALSTQFLELLRKYVDGIDILGIAIFTSAGKVLYSSLSLNILYNTIREFEVRNEKNIIQANENIIVLENNQKIFSQRIIFKGTAIIVLLIFSERVQLGMGDLLLEELVAKIKVIEKI